MLDKTINSALLDLRRQISRGDGAGLDHVEALLTLRGVDMEPVQPLKRLDAAKSGYMARMVLDILRGNPMTVVEVTKRVAERRPELSHAACRKRTALALTRLKRRKLVKREGRVWSLARTDQSSILNKSHTLEK